MLLFLHAHHHEVMGGAQSFCLIVTHSVELHLLFEWIIILHKSFKNWFSKASFYILNWLRQTLVFVTSCFVNSPVEVRTVCFFFKNQTPNDLLFKISIKHHQNTLKVHLFIVCSQPPASSNWNSLILLQKLVCNGKTPKLHSLVRPTSTRQVDTNLWNLLT